MTRDAKKLPAHGSGKAKRYPLLNANETAAYLNQHSMRDVAISGKRFGRLAEEYGRRL